MVIAGATALAQVSEMPPMPPAAQATMLEPAPAAVPAKPVTQPYPVRTQHPSRLAVDPKAAAAKWEQCHSGRKGGISGISLMNGNGEYLLILDNKKPDDDHVAILDYKPGAKPKYTKVEWPQEGEPPVDLESVTPAGMIETDSYFMLASSGRMFHVKLIDGNRRLKVLKVFDMPETVSGDNFEASFLFQTGDKLVLVWATRGEDKTPATVRCGVLNPKDYSISAVASTSFSVTWKKQGEVRHISDIFIDPEGTFYTLSASDAGDAGPFNSALFRAGKLVLSDAGAVFDKEAVPVKICDLDGYKAEGFVIDLGTDRSFVIGSDDEDSGSFVCRIAR